MLNRYLDKFVKVDLKEKMVFISGPRQVGKTTLSQQIGIKYYSSRYSYLNWDNRQDRQAILKGALPAEKELYIFDEIHKYKNWKNYLKGEYDKNKDRFRYLITGSARLDIFKKGGDSLLGRYYSFRLHPFSLSEVMGKEKKIELFKELEFFPDNKESMEIFENLYLFGGFPEVFIKQSEKELRRWHNGRVDRLIREDIRDVENLRDLSALEVLVELLPDKVGSLFSLNSLREDLNVTHKTLSHWIDILERFYYHYRIYPFQSTLIKSIRKEPKLYLWDWSEVADENSRLENIIASHLLKYCNYLHDVEGYKAKLHYLRDKEQREVDFLVAIDNKPWFSVEVKKSYKEIPTTLKYFREKLKIPFNYVVVQEKGTDFLKDNIRIISANKFLTGLV